MMENLNRLRIPGWWLVLPVLLLGLWLGARGLNMDNARSDELTTISHVGGMEKIPPTPAEIVDSLQTHSPQHTPLYFVLLNLWGRVAGFTLVPLRAIAMLAGVLGLAAIYRLGADVASPRVGLYATLILAMNAFFIFYFHEIRMYSFFMMLAALTYWLYYRLTQSATRPRWWVWFGAWACTVLLLYTHTFALMVMGTIAIFHLLVTAKNRRWLEVSALYIAAGIAYLPWLGVMLHGMALATAKRSVKDDLVNAGEFMRLLLVIFSNNQVLLLVPLLLLGLYAVYRQRTGARWIFLMALILLTLMIGLNEAMSLVASNQMRYTLGAWPLLAIMVGFGLVELERWRGLRLLIPAFFIVWPLAGVTMDGMLADNRYAGNSDFIREMLPFYELLPHVYVEAQPDDYILILSSSDLPFKERDKYKASVGDFYMTAVDNDYAILTHLILPENAVADTLDAIQQHPRVWVISQPDEESPLLPEFEQGLGAEYAPCPPLLVAERLQIDLYSKNGCATS